MEYRKAGEIRCWSCLMWMSMNEFVNADGFCVHCDSEIDIYENPYAGDLKDAENGIMLPVRRAERG